MRIGAADIMMLAALPSLAEIAAKPAMARSLSQNARNALIMQASAAIFALSASMIEAETSSTAYSVRRESPAPNEDRLLDVKEAARKLGISTSTLYKRANQYGFTIREGRLLRFSSHGIDRYIEQRQHRREA